MRIAMAERFAVRTSAPAHSKLAHSSTEIAGAPENPALSSPAASGPPRGSQQANREASEQLSHVIDAVKMMRTFAEGFDENIAFYQEVLQQYHVDFEDWKDLAHVKANELAAADNSKDFNELARAAKSIMQDLFKPMLERDKKFYADCNVFLAFAAGANRGWEKIIQTYRESSEKLRAEQALARDRLIDKQNETIQQLQANIDTMTATATIMSKKLEAKNEKLLTERDDWRRRYNTCDQQRLQLQKDKEQLSSELATSRLKAEKAFTEAATTKQDNKNRRKTIETLSIRYMQMRRELETEVSQLPLILRPSFEATLQKYPATVDNLPEKWIQHNADLQQLLNLPDQDDGDDEHEAGAST